MKGLILCIEILGGGGVGNVELRERVTFPYRFSVH